MQILDQIAALTEFSYSKVMDQTGDQSFGGPTGEYSRLVRESLSLNTYVLANPRIRARIPGKG